MVKGGEYLVWVGVCSDREEEDVTAKTYLPLAVKDAGQANSGKRPVLQSY
jgi:hypothetical protein